MALWVLFSESFKRNSGLLKAEPLPCCPRGTCEYKLWVQVFLTLRKQIPLSLLIAPKTASMLCFRSLSSRPGFSWSPQNGRVTQGDLLCLFFPKTHLHPILLMAVTTVPHTICNPSHLCCNIHLHCWIFSCFLQVWIYRQPSLLLLVWNNSLGIGKIISCIRENTMDNNPMQWKK